MTVYLVGAGPGDPGLLTVRGRELLEIADVVVYDRLAHRALLGSRARGRRAHRRRQGAGPRRDDAGRDQRAARRARRATRCVVRLKGGDPFVFGRGGEEAEACAAAGIAVRGGAGYHERDRGARVRRDPRHAPGRLDPLHGRHRPRRPDEGRERHRLGRARARRRDARGADGRGAGRRDRQGVDRRRAQRVDTPVAAVRWGTRPEQTHDPRHARRRSPTRESKRRARSSSATSRRLDFGWFEQRPLFGRTIVVTRAREQASELRAELELLGADVVELPTIAIEPVTFTVPDLDAYEWIVFTSANGVDAFFVDGLAAPDSMRARSPVCTSRRSGPVPPMRSRPTASAPISSPTASSPSRSSTRCPPGTGRILLARAEVARDVLPDGLAAKGYAVDVLGCVPDDQCRARPRRARARARRGRRRDHVYVVVDGDQLLRRGRRPRRADNLPIVSIGPVTSETARARGLRVDAEADPHTIAGVVAALLETLRR